ncbi:hypothetical protein [Clostridium sp. CMCC3677]|nr:hypothetical protein [Clostridium sp. CMCC3677]
MKSIIDAGETIELRIGKQKASFRNNNQFGADTMERIVNNYEYRNFRK